MEIGPVSDKGSDQPSQKKMVDPAQPTAASEREDSLELSREARLRIQDAAEKARLDGSVDVHDSTEESEREKKLAQVRSRIETGYYTRPEVVEQIVDRLTDEIGRTGL